LTHPGLCSRRDILHQKQLGAEQPWKLRQRNLAWQWLPSSDSSQRHERRRVEHFCEKGQTTFFCGRGYFAGAKKNQKKCQLEKSTFC